MNRRSVLVGGGTTLSAVIAGCSSSADEDSVTISVSDQFGTKELQIDTVETNVGGRVEIVDEVGTKLAPSIAIDAGETYDEYAVQLTEPLEEKQEVTVRFVHDERVVAESTATVRPTVAELERGAVTLVEAQPARGFNYPYYAYIPDDTDSSGPVFVEPNNTGTSTDDFEEHRRHAEAILESDSWTRELVDELGLPFLVPVFPRPESDPRDWRHYVHSLDAETMGIDGGPLERVDLQLLEMVDHYRDSLAISVGYDAAAEFHLNGFGAAGVFANRFTALHPDRVRAVTAGGVNGTLILPREAVDGTTLPYPIGVADLPELIGDDFDEAAWADVPQFIYHGAESANDTIPYDDAWNDRQRRLALEVYGEDIRDDRMPYCESVYDEADANAQIHVYENVGHTVPRWTKRDVYEFHRKHVDGKGFGPIKIRKARDLEIAFADRPRAGDSEISVRLSVPDRYKIGDTFSDGSVSVMLDTGTEIEWADRIRLDGQTHFRPDELPVDGTYTYETDRPLEFGDELTVGIMDGQIITADTITVS